MYKKTIAYTDYDGNEREEDFYFNLTKAELLEMELSMDGGLSKTIQRISKAQQTSEIIRIFKDLILKAYGEKTPDGKRFRKKDENGNRLADAFAETEAYSILFMELGTNSDSAIAFVNGIAPKMDKDITKADIEEAMKNN